MTDFNQQTLAHLKKLCRIDCDAAEDAEILVSLKRVINYIEQLDQAPEIEAGSNISLSGISEKARFREDIADHVMTREQFLGNAPDQIAGMVRIPPVLKPQ